MASHVYPPINVMHFLNKKKKKKALQTYDESYYDADGVVRKRPFQLNKKNAVETSTGKHDHRLLKVSFYMS